MFIAYFNSYTQRLFIFQMLQATGQNLLKIKVKRPSTFIEQLFKYNSAQINS